MKTYGILDGLVVGLATGLLIIAGVVATHDYESLTWVAFAAALVVAAAMVFAAKRGHGMVDGVILRPWQRQLLLAMVVVEAGIISSPFFESKDSPAGGKDSSVDETGSSKKLAADGCGWLATDLVALEQVAKRKEGTASDALMQHAFLRVKANTCDDALKNRLAAVQDRLAAWYAESNESGIDVEKTQAQLNNALPPPVIESPSPRPDAQPDRTPFVPDFAYIPPALIPSPPPGTLVTVTAEEKRRSALAAILRLFSGGFSFGDTKITTTMILGQTMQSADDHGRAMLQAMVDNIPKDRSDRLAEFWLQLRRLANDPATPEDQRQTINAFLYSQGPVPILCDWVLLSVGERIGEEVAAGIRIDESRVNDFIKSPSSDEWPKVYADVEVCVYQRDRNHFPAYQPGLKALQSMRKEASGE